MSSEVGTYEQVKHGSGRKLFNYYLKEQVTQSEIKPLFFRRMNRWRVNSVEYANPFSKKGLFRGYIKYGCGAYYIYFYLRYQRG